MDQYEFYKELYHKENDRRNDVINTYNIPILIITTITTALYFLITNYDYAVKTQNWIFITLISISVGLLIMGVYNLIRAYIDFAKSYEYKGIPYPDELDKWRKNLMEFYKQQDQNNAVAKTDEHFANYLTESFIRYISHNMYVNDRKLSFIFNSKKYSVACLITLMITLVPFSINYSKKSEKIYKVEVNSKI